MISLDGIQVHHGDCLDVLRTLPDCSVDAVICDPPYGLSDLKPAAVTKAIVAWASGDRENVPDARGFMGRSWDAFVPPPAVWDECYRVLKPGGHIAAFAGSRTQDLMGLSIRMAGFEIRDGLAWLMGSGMPKSLDVAKAIDKAGGGSPVDQARVLAVARARSGMTREEVAAVVGCSAASVCTWEEGRSRAGVVEYVVPSPAYRAKLADLLGYTADERSVVGVRLDRRGDGTVLGLGHSGTTYGGPATDAAREWSGWGTGLKPSHEPIILARRPLAGTVAANVLQFGTGALNIDACRVATDEDRSRPPRTPNAIYGGGRGASLTASESNPSGRWPANVLLTHAPDCDDSACQPGCPVSELDAQSGTLKSGGRTFSAGDEQGAGWRAAEGRKGPRLRATAYDRAPDQGGASRFFPSFRYQAKAGKAERPKVDGVAHSTVKPVAVMAWLVKLLTPPGGTVLEPFAGSGTTVEACIDEGFHVIAVEREAEYLPLIQHRVDRALARRNVAVDPPMDLFTEFEEHAS